MIKGFKDKEAGKIWQGLASRRFPKNIQDVARRKLRMLNNGEILLEEFLKPMGLSQNALARAMDVSPRRINEIVLEKRAITADTALRLALAFGTSEQFRMGLQADSDLDEAKKKSARSLRKVRPVAA